MLKTLIFSLLLVSGFSLATQAPYVYRIVEREYQIPSSLLYAIALTESGVTLHTGQHVPWPWTLNVRGEARFFRTRKEALKNLYQLKIQGIRSVDIGQNQINWRWHSEKFISFNDALNPQKNIQIAAIILTDCYRQRGAWYEAVGCYHSPNNKKRADRYTEKVLKKWKNFRLGRYE